MCNSNDINISKELCLVILHLLFIIPQNAHSQKFVLPVIPDTQVEVNVKPQMFYSQLRWLANSQDSLNIPFVLHVGDVVDYNNFNHWEKASYGFEILDDADIPYAIAVGNHDTRAVGKYSGSAAPGNVNANLRITDKLNSYFPVHRFFNQRGVYEEGKSDNAFYTFRAGGLNWLVLTLEFCPRRGPVNWASDIISNHSNYNVIVLTHYFLTSKGQIGQTNAGYGNLSPEQVYNYLIKSHSNVLMVLSGHVCCSGYHIDKGENGNSIYEILQDYQRKDSGGGYLRLLEINPEAGTIEAKMYSPYYNKTKNDSSQFIFRDVNFIQPK